TGRKTDELLAGQEFAPDRVTETEYAAGMLSKVQRFAISHGVNVFFVAHPFKLPKEGGKAPVPLRHLGLGDDGALESKGRQMRVVRSAVYRKSAQVLFGRMPA